MEERGGNEDSDLEQQRMLLDLRTEHTWFRLLRLIVTMLYFRSRIMVFQADIVYE
jgi:hypothetical protein